MTQSTPLCGFLNVLKPPGMSSAQVVGYVRRLLDGAKVGHAGTLDPEAAGVLPLMVGKAARLFGYLQDKEKEYVAEAAFGVATDTQDAQVAPVETGENWPDREEIASALERFTGTILQTPPMYSAIKQGGRRLYELARSGREAQVSAREVTVYALNLRSLTPRHGALLHIRCSGGFYVRTLCHDLGQALGCPAHMRFLLRTRSGPFTLETAATLEELASRAQAGTLSRCLLPLEVALDGMPMADVPEDLEKPVRNGGYLPWERFAPLAGGRAAEGSPFGLRLNGALCAIAERQDDVVRMRTWLGQ